MCKYYTEKLPTDIKLHVQIMLSESAGLQTFRLPNDIQ